MNERLRDIIPSSMLLDVNERLRDIIPNSMLLDVNERLRVIIPNSMLLDMHWIWLHSYGSNLIFTSIITSQFKSSYI
jgi:hypothetical protein